MPRTSPTEIAAGQDGVNVAAMLDTICYFEIGRYLPGSDDGYNVQVGGKLFHDYSKHPGVIVQVRPGLRSSAAGRYQYLKGTWKELQSSLRLPDFGPHSQDTACIRLLRRCKALAAILNGDPEQAIERMNGTWASMPGAGYGQPEYPMATVLAKYRSFGGI